MFLSFYPWIKKLAWWGTEKHFCILFWCSFACPCCFLWVSFVSHDLPLRFFYFPIGFLLRFRWPPVGFPLASPWKCRCFAIDPPLACHWPSFGCPAFLRWSPPPWIAVVSRAFPPFIPRCFFICVPLGALCCSSGFAFVFFWFAIGLPLFSHHPPWFLLMFVAFPRGFPLVFP